MIATDLQPSAFGPGDLAEAHRLAQRPDRPNRLADRIFAHALGEGVGPRDDGRPLRVDSEAAMVRGTLPHKSPQARNNALCSKFLGSERR